MQAGLLPSDEAERVAALDSMRRAGVVYALGIEGKLTELPLLEADEDLVAGRSDILGEGGLGGGQGVRVHVDGSKVAVGDLAVFGELFGREEGRNRALGLVGMDVWGRQRVIISARNGALFV